MHLLTSKLWSMAQNRGFDWWSKNIASGEFSLATRRRLYFADRRVIYFATS
jgi:hypothetical protein